MYEQDFTNYIEVHDAAQKEIDELTERNDLIIDSDCIEAAVFKGDHTIVKFLLHNYIYDPQKLKQLQELATLKVYDYIIKLIDQYATRTIRSVPS